MSATQRQKQRAAAEGRGRAVIAGVGRLLAPVVGFSTHYPLGAISAGWILVTIVIAIFGDQLAPYEAQAIVGLKLLPPSGEHLMGTDQIGRDLFSRVLGGARVAVQIGFTAVILGSVIGGAWGILAGYVGGKFDLVTQRFIDMMMAFPTLLLALFLVATLGASVANVIIALTIGTIPSKVRVMRSVAMSVKTQPYIDAARTIGATEARIVLRHVAPNCLATLFILFSLSIGGVIVAEASLSFLGIGVPPDVPSWGGMLQTASKYLVGAPWLAFFSGAAISITVLAFNVLGDALRDSLDPKLRGR